MQSTKLSHLIIAIWLTSILFGLGSCRKADERLSGSEDVQLAAIELPDSVQQVHIGNILLITWFEKPFPGYYDRLTLRSDGTVEHWRIDVNWAAHGVGIGQLTQDQQEEIRAILKTLAETSSLKPSAGSDSITLSFLWKGENHVLSFDETSCARELHRILQIADMALGRQEADLDASQNICQQGDEYQGQRQNLTPSDDTSTLPVDLPDSVRLVHDAPRLFCITWFDQPFDGSYNKLSMFANGSIVYWEVLDGGDREVVRGRLTETERRDAQITLNLITNADAIGQSVGTTIITLSFPWEADYHLITFGDSNCSESLHNLFEMANIAFKRARSELTQYPNPCQVE